MDAMIAHAPDERIRANLVARLHERRPADQSEGWRGEGAREARLIELEMFVAEPGNVTLFNAVFSDSESLPWRTEGRWRLT